MATDKIRDFTAGVLATDTAALTAAEQELMAAVTAAGAATTAVDAAAKAAEAKASVIAATRAQMAAAATATEALALADALLQLEIGLHELTALLTKAQYQANLAQARLARATRSVSRAKQALADSTQANKAALDEDKAWQDNIAPLIASLRARNPKFSDAATALKASAVYTAAQTRVVGGVVNGVAVPGEIPQPLLGQARARITAAGGLKPLVDQATADETAAETAAIGKYGTHLGKPGAVAVARLDYERKRGRLRSLADAERQLTDITTTLTAIKTAPLAPAGVVSRRDATLQRVVAQQALIDAKEAEIVAAPANAQAALRLQKTALEAALVPLNNILEDAVPEEAWRRLSALDAATAQLDAFIALTNAAIDTIIVEAKDAEKVLATAMKTEADARLEIAGAETTLTEKRDLATAAREHAQAQLVAALRGDV